MNNLINFTKTLLSDYLTSCTFELVGNDHYEKKDYDSGKILETGVSYLLDILDESNYRTRILVKIKGHKKLYSKSEIVDGIHVNLLGAYVSFLDKDGVYLKATGIDEIIK
ncbi:MAG: hypothetical protein K9L62_12860 [Vallitaleaceae bacterium]|nr:hypothetical protein [Vallitaleaceae bacterium]